MTDFFGLGISDPFSDFDTDPFDLGFGNSTRQFGNVFGDRSFNHPGYFSPFGYHPFFGTTGYDQDNIPDRPGRRYIPPRRRRVVDRAGGEIGHRGKRSFATRSDRTSDWLPDWDVVNTDREVIVAMEVPGISKDDIKIDVEDGRLVISGERPMDELLKGSDNVKIREREFGHFKRRVKLPEGCDIHKISAKVNEGILEVHVPKGADEPAVRVNIQ